LGGQFRLAGRWVLDLIEWLRKSVKIMPSAWIGGAADV
jgi:hypothetical protein